MMMIFSAWMGNIIMYYRGCHVLKYSCDNGSFYDIFSLSALWYRLT